MIFEFDPAKSDLNRTKHGIDFVEAQELWRDPFLLEAPARATDEPRMLVIGRVGARHWAAIITVRSGKVRIISVRRARKEEVTRYEGE